jgi:hypothetical protein
VDLDEVADELYGLRPEEFTAARDDRARQARAAGQRDLAGQIRGLRRPTLAAWASNLLVREQQEDVAPLLRLGEQLRDAHRDLDGQELRALSHRQHQLVAALARQAGRLASDAGQPLGPQAQQEVAQTLQAVLSDPGAAREWAGGRLAKPLSVAVGFDAAAEAAGPQTRTGAGRTRKRNSSSAGTASSSGKSARRSDSTADGGRSRADGKARQAGERTRQAEERARRDAEEAAARAEELKREAEAADGDAEAARSAREEAGERVERLREELREAEREHTRRRKNERETDRTAREARRRAEEAGKRARQSADAAPSARRGRSGKAAPRGGRRGR